MERAKYGAAAIADLTGKLPNPFPRTMGPNAMKFCEKYEPEHCEIAAEIIRRVAERNRK